MPQNVSSLVVYYNVDLFEDGRRAAARSRLDLGRLPGRGQGSSPATGATASASEANTDPPRAVRLVRRRRAGRRPDATRPRSRWTRPEPATASTSSSTCRRCTASCRPRPRSSRGRARRASSTATLGMYLNSRASVPTLRTIEGFEWDVAPMPVAPGGEPASILHGDAYCMSRGLDRAGRDLAVRRVRELASRARPILAESGRTVPSRTRRGGVGGVPATRRPAARPRRCSSTRIATLRAVPHTATWSQVEGEADEIIRGDVLRPGRPRGRASSSSSDVTGPLFGAAGP